VPRIPYEPSLDLHLLEKVGRGGLSTILRQKVSYVGLRLLSYLVEASLSMEPGSAVHGGPTHTLGNNAVCDDS
jgi:hypothetical protein